MPGTGRVALGQVLRRCHGGDLSFAGEPLEGVRLDLAHAFARQAYLAADHLQGLRVLVAVQPVAELDHLLLAVRQLRHRGA